MEHVLNPARAGDLVGATHDGVAGEPGEGPYVRIRLRARGECVEQASYETFGCPAAIACGSLVARLAEGRTFRELLRLEPEDLVMMLGGLPDGKEHCPRLAVTALRRAMDASGATGHEEREPC